MTRLHIFTAVIVAGLAWAGIAYLQQARREARDAAQKAEQRQRDEAALAARIESEERAKRERAAIQTAIAGALRLKQALKEPDSFVLQSALIYGSGAVCYGYMVKNSYGPSRAILDPQLALHAEVNKRSSFDGYWAQFCTGDGGQEVAQQLQASALSISSPARQKAEQTAPANTDAVKGALVVPRGPNEPRARQRTPKP